MSSALYNQTFFTPDYSNYRLNGKLYITDMDVMQQNPGIGLTNYKIDIGIHDILSEQQFNTSLGLAMKGKRDWFTIMFNLNHFDAIGSWKCVDGYSDFNYSPHNLSSYTPNAVDSMQNCLISDIATSQSLVDGRITITSGFIRSFNTTDQD